MVLQDWAQSIGHRDYADLRPLAERAAFPRHLDASLLPLDLFGPEVGELRDPEPSLQEADHDELLLRCLAGGNESVLVEITRPRGSVDEPRLSGLIADAKPSRLG